MSFSVNVAHLAGFGDWIKGVLSGLADILTEWVIDPLVTFITYIFGMFFYGIQIGIFYVIDLVQMVVRKVAGLPAYSINGERTYGYMVDGEERNDDLVMYLIESEIVQQVFISILIAAVFLLFIATVVAVLKSETDAKSNAKGPIFGNAIKSIVYFFMVPVVCYLGIMVSNIVLRTLDGATSRDAISFSAQIFTAATFNENRILEDDKLASEIYEAKIVPGTSQISSGEFYINKEEKKVTDIGKEKLAALVDDCFLRGLSPVTDGSPVQMGGEQQRVTVQIETVGGWGIGSREYSFDKYDVKDYALVFKFYDVIGYNYLIGYAGGLTIMVMLLQLLIGIIRRLFELATLFVVSPAIVALMPLDGGEKFKVWKDNFIKRVFSAYGPIIGMNLCFMVLELMQDITLF